jgi:drug/metabolite transporter (DMT)-like permease
LWLALLSTLLLREKLKPILLVALLVGFAGALLLLRPTFGDSTWVAGVLGLCSGFFAACAYFNVKKLGAVGEPEWRVVFYFGLAGIIGSAFTQGVAVGHFSPIGATQWLPLIAMGLAATLAQLAMTRAYHSGSTLVVGAFAYSTVVFAAIFGIVVFDEVLPPIAWCGMALIVASGLLAKWAEPAPKKGAALPAEED